MHHSLFIHLLMDFWIIFRFELLQIVKMNILYKFVCGHVFCFSWVIYISFFKDLGGMRGGRRIKSIYKVENEKDSSDFQK